MTTLSGKLALSALLLGLATVVTGIATFAAFSSTTSNSGDSYEPGTVYLTDNDAGAELYSVTGQSPGSQVQRCITATYTGSLDADVRLYVSAVGATGQYIDLLVETGSGNITFPSCTGFVPDASPTLYSGTLKDFADTHSSYATGLVDNPGSATKWVTNDSVVYRLTLTVQSNPGSYGSTGSHTFHWEARNQ